jgi:hypothetical protein
MAPTEGSPVSLRPLNKIRRLLERCAAMEQRVLDLQDRMGGLQQALDQQREAQRESERVADVRFRELRDSVHVAARRSGLTRRPTRVLFLVHHIEAWDAYHDLVQAMRSSTDFEPIVASIPRHFRGSDGFTYEEEIHRALDQHGVSHIRLRAHEDDEALRLLKAIDPDLVFRQSQWDADVPGDFGTDRLTFARLCLVPYETMNLVQNVPLPDTANSAVDNPLHRAAWAVFCTNDLMLEMARTDGARAGQQFRVTGHPKADRIRRATPSWPLPGRPTGDGVRRIVWSAHHSIGTKWSNFGAFPAMADDMLAWAAEDGDAEFVFMPHPTLFPFVHSADSPVPAEQLDRWLADWEALPNTALVTSGDYPPLLAASDLLITDGLSMLVEYQLLQRPVVFVERPDHRPFTAIGEIVRNGTHAVASVAEARAVERRFRQGEPDPLRELQASNVERLFGSEPSVQRILATLREMLAAERGQTPTAEPHASLHAVSGGSGNRSAVLGLVAPD